MSLFVSFEGIDGAGKSTQIVRTEAWLQQLDYDVLVRREPGGTELGEAIRDILLDHKWTTMNSRSEFLLYSASRAQLVEEVIKPHLRKSRAVMILDRYFDSSTAYQGGGRELDIDAIQAIHPFVTDHLSPDLTIYLDVEWEMSRLRLASSSPDRLEQNSRDFFERVRSTYLKLCESDSSRLKRIDASADEATVFREVKRTIEKLL